ncbi:MAG: ABC transporter permease [Blastocatellia bacterium]
MLKLILYRLLQGLLVLLIVSLLIFTLLAAAGGDALTALGNDPRVSEETMVALRRIYGLDQPLMARYAQWLAAAAQGGLGHSFYFQAPVASIIWPRFLRTMAVATVALIIAWTIALTLGIIAARRAGGWVDRVCSALVLLASSTPRLVLALLTLAFAVRTARFSAGGPTSELEAGAWLQRLLPPAFVLSCPLVALFLAHTRANVGAMLNEDFVRVARAKGLPERTILLRHALRPALGTLITIFGYSLGGLVSGSVIVEKVLGWPGLGQLIVIAVESRDVPLLMGAVLVTATAVLLGNLLADILLRLNDPRLR